MVSMHEREKSTRTTKKNMTVEILRRATHAKNALKLISPDTRSAKLRDIRRRAQAFFDDHVEKGFLFFREYSSQAPS